MYIEHPGNYPEDQPDYEHLILLCINKIGQVYVYDPRDGDFPKLIPRYKDIIHITDHKHIWDIYGNVFDIPDDILRS